MKVDVKDLLESAGLGNETLYPGKKLIKKYVQHGEHKSHCVVFDWEGRNIHVEVKAGISGHTLDPKELRHYPVSFQARTYLEVQADNDNADEDDDGTNSASGKGGGGKQPKKKGLENTNLSSMSAFAKNAEGSISTLGEIKKFVIMGKEIAREAYAQALENFKSQLAQTKIMAMDLMKGVADVIKKATPGGGLEAKGDETIKYRYDAERTAPMFGGLTPS